MIQTKHKQAKFLTWLKCEEHTHLVDDFRLLLRVYVKKTAIRISTRHDSARPSVNNHYIMTVSHSDGKPAWTGLTRKFALNEVNVFV